MSAFIVPLSSLPSITPLSQAGSEPKAQNNTENDVPFTQFLQNALNNLADSSVEMQMQTMNLATGGSDDLHTGAIAALKYNTAVSYASNLTSTAIRAYKELMTMQF